MDDTVVCYQGKPVSVPKEVADFLAQDRRRAQAQSRRDRRHLSRSRFERASPRRVPAGRVTEDHALKSLQLENLRNAVTALDDQERKLVYLRYNGELYMEEIGRTLGVSKMAVSKRLKKLHQKLRASVA